MSKIAILSDIHSNLEALEAVLQEIEKLQTKEIWCLGDLTGYGPEPNKCVQLAQEKFAVCLLGNHDQGVLDKTCDWRFNPYAKAALAWTRKVTGEKNKDFLRKLKSKATLNDCLLVHGSPRSPCWEYILEEDTETQNFKSFEEQICFFGHTHIPLVLREDLKRIKGSKINLVKDSRYLVNPGSVGQPRDYNPKASFLLFDNKKGVLEFKRVRYQINETQKKMEKVGLPKFLIERLSLGY